MSALKSFKQWVYLMQQIHEAKFYIGRAEELGHPHLLKSYNDILEFLAHFRAALNSYAKCFVSTGSGRKRLQSSVVFGGNPARLSQHNQIIELRHKYIAHSDENEFESANVLEEETTTELVLSLQYGFSFPFDRLYELRDLIGLLEVHGVDRQQVHISGIGSETGKSVRVLEGGSGNA